MNKLITAIVVIIILIGGYYWLAMPKTAGQITATGNVATTTQTATAVTFEMKSGGFYFKPNSLKVKLGQLVTINIDTAGGMHTFTIDELGVNVNTPGGQVTTVTFTPTKKGTFEFYCAMAGHRAKGQVGTLIVE